ncbi:MAG: TadE/TadG family type IV pilus assembly protein [Allosphingosinicella sp.]
MRRPWRQLGDERGVAAVEFGILLIPLTVMLLGLLDVGYHMYVRSVLQGALNDVARQASVENPVFTSEGDTIDEQIDSSLRARMDLLVHGGTFDIDKSAYHEFSRMGRPEKLTRDVDGDGQVDRGDCWRDDVVNGQFDLDSGRTGTGGADDIVMYNVTVVTPRIVPIANFINLDEDLTITVATSIRNQPYADQPEAGVACLP